MLSLAELFEAVYYKFAIRQHLASYIQCRSDRRFSTYCHCSPGFGLISDGWMRFYNSISCEKEIINCAWVFKVNFWSIGGLTNSVSSNKPPSIHLKSGAMRGGPGLVQFSISIKMMNMLINLAFENWTNESDQQITYKLHEALCMKELINFGTIRIQTQFKLGSHWRLNWAWSNRQCLCCFFGNICKPNSQVYNGTRRDEFDTKIRDYFGDFCARKKIFSVESVSLIICGLNTGRTAFSNFDWIQSLFEYVRFWVGVWGGGGADEAHVWQQLERTLESVWHRSANEPHQSALLPYSHPGIWSRFHNFALTIKLTTI